MRRYPGSLVVDDDGCQTAFLFLEFPVDNQEDDYIALPGRTERNSGVIGPPGNASGRDQIQAPSGQPPKVPHKVSGEATVEGWIARRQLRVGRNLGCSASRR